MNMLLAYGLFCLGVITGVSLIIIGLSKPGDNFLIDLVIRIYRKYFPIFSLALIVILATSAAAWAGENSATGMYWRVTGVENTRSPEGRLIGRKLRYSRNLDSKDDMYVVSSIFEPEWDVIKQVELYNWLWTGITKDGKIEVVFDCVPSAGVELGRKDLKQPKKGE